MTLVNRQKIVKRGLFTGLRFTTPGFDVLINALSAGRVAEWLKAPDSKSEVVARLPWVRIPPLPPYNHDALDLWSWCWVHFQIERCEHLIKSWKCQRNIDRQNWLWRTRDVGSIESGKVLETTTEKKI